MGAILAFAKRALMTFAVIGGGTGAAVTFNPDVTTEFPKLLPIAGQIGLWSGLLFGAYKGVKEFFRK